MRHIVPALRFLLGLCFVVFGTNGFVHFMPMPEDLPYGVKRFTEALQETGYMLELIGATQILGGLLLWIPRLVPLGLVVLAPVTINIVAFHLFLDPDPANGLPGYIVAAVHLVLVIAYAGSFRCLFHGRVDPH